MYLSAAATALVPAGVVTRTSTVPVPAGAVATILPADDTENDEAALVPNLTALAPLKALPVIVTLVPPTAGPLVGLRPAMAGAAT